MFDQVRRNVSSLAFVLLLSSWAQAVCAQQIVLDRGTAAGDLRGFSDGHVDTYFGIPFAEPPVDDLRWSTPVPARPWEGIRDASEKGNSCVQLPVAGQPVMGSEDCLYLDVYVPSGTRAEDRLAVFVYFYGGAMVTGSSRDIDASRLAERENVIVVVPNYRLGVFGFLTLPELDAKNASGVSGNWALLDQQLALHWVHDNIGQFGGDAAQVTIGGQSAGGYSVGMHLLAPESWPLFNRGIVMGMPFLDGHSIWNMPGYVTNQFEQSEGPSSYLPILTNCDGQLDQLQCLRNLPTTAIAAAVARRPNLRWSPTIDGHHRADLPPRMVARGEIRATPLLIGTNHNEGGLNVLRMLEHSGGQPLLSADYVDSTLAQEDGQRVLDRYPAGDFPSPEMAVATVRSRDVNCRLLRTAGMLSQFAPAYTYLFADEDAPSLGYTFPHYDAGSYHAAEIQYVFGSGYPQDAMPGPAQFSAEQLALSDRMMHYWGNFIRTGQPAGTDQWPDFGSSGITLRLQPGAVDQQVSQEQFRGTYDCEFWDGLDHAR